VLASCANHIYPASNDTSVPPNSPPIRPHVNDRRGSFLAGDFSALFSDEVPESTKPDSGLLEEPIVLLRLQVLEAKGFVHFRLAVVFFCFKLTQTFKTNGIAFLVCGKDLQRLPTLGCMLSTMGRCFALIYVLIHWRLNGAKDTPFWPVRTTPW